jgi:microcin C transport system substrate-binding protein
MCRLYHVCCTALLFFYLSCLLYAQEDCFTIYQIKQGNGKYNNKFSQLKYVDIFAKKGGKVEFGIVGNIETLNPYGIVGIQPKDYLLLSYDSLFFVPLDDVNIFLPLLATSACILEGKKEVIITLNTMAKWSDGSNIKSVDVVFTIEYAKKHGLPYYRNLLKDVHSVALDSYRVKIIADEIINNDALSTIFSMPIIAKTYWENINTLTPTLKNPIVSGGYAVADAVYGKKITFIKRDDYWGKDLPVRAGTFNLEEIVYHYAIAKQGLKGLPLDLVQIEESKNIYKNVLRVAKISDDRILPFKGLIFNTSGVLQKKGLRELIYNLYDFATVKKTLLNDNTQQFNSLFTGSNFYRESTIKHININENLDLVYDKLNELGYNADNPLVLTIVFKNQQTLQENISFLYNLKKVGIQTKVILGSLLEYKKIKENKGFDIIEDDYIFANPPSAELLLYFVNQSGYNSSAIFDSKINSLINNIVQNKGNKVSLLKQLDADLFNKRIFIPLYYEQYNYYNVRPDILIPSVKYNLGIDITTIYISEKA